MFRIILAAILSVFLIQSLSTSQRQSYVPKIDGVWKIIDVKFTGAETTLDEESARRYIGEKVEIYKGYFSSPFRSCDYCGLEKKYKVHLISSFLKENPELKNIDINGKYLAVHELSFGSERKHFLTIITLDDNKRALIPWEGVYFILAID